MVTLLKIAWLNVWRNRTRSLTVIVGIALGLWAGVFVMGFYMGLFNQKVDTVIRSEVSHLQVHHPQFREDLEVQYLIPEGSELQEELEAMPEVVAAAGRTLVMGMGATSHGTVGLRVNGIDLQAEDTLRNLSETLVEGTFFEGTRRNPVVVSRKLADKLRLKIRSKLILQFQDIHGEITAANFRVSGIYKSSNGMFDQANIFVRSTDLQKLLGAPGQIHEIAVLLNSHDLVDPFTEKLQRAHPDLEIKSWMDLSPGMRYALDAVDMAWNVIIGIILFALMFGIINTMLMAVMERVREIGMLMAIGMKKGRVFAMIMLETVILALIGGPIGLLLSFAFITWTGSHGIDLGDYSATLENMGYPSRIYPHLEAAYYAKTAFQVIGMALFASLFPAFRALRLKPVEAIRKI